MAMDTLLRNMAQKKGLLKDQLRLVKRKDLDRYEIERIFDPLSFEKGIFLFIRGCQLLARNMDGVILVGLAGPSGAGKTVFSEKVSKFMPGITVISLDNYNDGSRIVDGNFDDPRLTDYDLLLQNIHDLKLGKAVEVPIYDFKASRRVGYRKVEVPPSRIVILEGIYALSEKLRSLLDLRVSVTGGVHFDLVKRVLRDINRSGQAPEDIIQQVSETVYPMYKVFIEPDLETAHIRIVNKFNPFLGLQSPTYILKSSVIVSEDKIRDALSPCCTETTEETYDIYLLPPGEDPETCQSYLRMRNRDGKYNLMFEECLVDGPFIISPRITFEVSVRLLGGLMALGYTIAAILKRLSNVYCSEAICVKIDKVELLQQKFIQVQGKDRNLVADVAKRLGLEGSYVPHPYIEQIHLEKLTAEVLALPDDLKSQLTITEAPASSPIPTFSWVAEVKPGVKNQYRRSLMPSVNKETSNIGVPINHLQNHSRSQSFDQHGRENTKINDGMLDSPSRMQGGLDYANFSEQMIGLNERIDEILLRLGEVELKLSSWFTLAQAKQGPVGSFGNNFQMENGHAHGFESGRGYSPPIAPASTAASAADLPVAEELRMLAQGQRHMTIQLDVVSNLLRQKSVQLGQYGRTERKGWWEDFLGKAKTTDSGLFTAMGVLVLGLGGLAGILMVRTFR